MPKGAAWVLLVGGEISVKTSTSIGVAADGGEIEKKVAADLAVLAELEKKKRRD
jgi:hypothetical protein